MTHDCDLCGGNKRSMLPQDPRIAVCKHCGFVYVPERRSPAEVAAAWADVYASGGYDPQWPGVKARLYYVAEWIDQHIGIKGKRLLDIGAGKGEFLGLVATRGAYYFGGIEPAGSQDSPWNFWYELPIEEVPLDKLLWQGKFDIVTINWTLENSADALAMLRFARECVADDGHVVVATGSRILVPFKKSLSSYLAPDRPADLHCFRWSFNSLHAVAEWAGFELRRANDYQDRDEMVLAFSPWLGDGFRGNHDCDNPDEVLGFFAAWERMFG